MMKFIPTRHRTTPRLEKRSDTYSRFQIRTLPTFDSTCFCPVVLEKLATVRPTAGNAFYCIVPPREFLVLEKRASSVQSKLNQLPTFDTNFPLVA